MKTPQSAPLRTSRFFFGTALCAFTSLAVLSLPAYGDNRNWDNAAGGQFHQAENWQGDIAPLPADAARFGLNADYTVTFDSNTTVTSLHILQAATGVMTFDLQGHTLTATSTNVAQAALVYDTSSAAAGSRLRLINGRVDVQTLRLGHSGDAQQAAQIEVGSNARLILRGDSRIGNQRRGELLVGSGGTVEAHATVEVGRSAAGSGLIRVEGGHMNFRPGGTGSGQNLYLGINSTEGSSGRVEVLGGGSIAGVNNLDLGRSTAGSGSSGELLVSGTNSRVTARILSVGGYFHPNQHDMRPMDNGWVEVADGGAINATERFDVYAKGQVHFNGGNVTAGSSHWQEGARFRLSLGDAAAAPLIVLGNMTLEGSEIAGVELILDATSHFLGTVGSVYAILSYGGELSGTFYGLAEGAIITVDEQNFILSYGSGSNDAVTLTMIPERSSAALLTSLAGVLLLLVMRHRRR